MLTTDDKKFILQTIDDALKQSFQNFYESIFEPYATMNEKYHQRLEKKLDAVKGERIRK